MTHCANEGRGCTVCHPPQSGTGGRVERSDYGVHFDWPSGPTAAEIIQAAQLLVVMANDMYAAAAVHDHDPIDGGTVVPPRYAVERVPSMGTHRREHD